jgi:hypothetical protein
MIIKITLPDPDASVSLTQALAIAEKEYAKHKVTMVWSQQNDTIFLMDLSYIGENRIVNHQIKKQIIKQFKKLDDKIIVEEKKVEALK